MKFIPFLNNLFRASFRCYYSDGSSTTHYHTLFANEIVKWIDCYKFTHPDCVSISVKVWFDDQEDADED